MLFLAKEQGKRCSRAISVPGQPQLPYSCLSGPGDGVGFAQGGCSTELSSGRAVLAFLGAPERPGRAGRAWRAGCDVKPGGGSVGPSAPIPRPAHAPVTARTINTLFPAPKPFSKACRVPGPAAPPRRAAKAPPAPGADVSPGLDVPSTGELSCSACCWLEHPDTCPPPRAMRAHPRVLHHKTWALRIREPNGPSLGYWGARGALRSKTWGGCFLQQQKLIPLIPGKISPGSSDLPLSKDQRLGTSLSLFLGDGQGMAKGRQQRFARKEDSLTDPSVDGERVPEVNRAHHPSQSSASHSRDNFLPPAAPVRSLRKRAA